MSEESPIASAEALDWDEIDHGERTFQRKRIARAAGGEDLGASLYRVPAGKKTWPRHYHEGNEEALFVLDGSATLRLGPDAESHKIAEGDYVALPAGEEGAHELEAGPDGLEYLATSTMDDPDVTVYPDNDAVGVFAGSPPGGDKSERSLSKYLDLDAEVEYWDE